MKLPSRRALIALCGGQGAVCIAVAVVALTVEPNTHAESGRRAALHANLALHAAEHDADDRSLASYWSALEQVVLDRLRNTDGYDAMPSSVLHELPSPDKISITPIGPQDTNRFVILASSSPDNLYIGGLVAGFNRNLDGEWQLQGSVRVERHWSIWGVWTSSNGERWTVAYAHEGGTQTHTTRVHTFTLPTVGDGWFDDHPTEFVSGFAETVDDGVLVEHLRTISPWDPAWGGEHAAANLGTRARPHSFPPFQHPGWKRQTIFSLVPLSGAVRVYPAGASRGEFRPNGLR